MLEDLFWVVSSALSSVFLTSELKLAHKTCHWCTFLEIGLIWTSTIVNTTWFYLKYSHANPKKAQLSEKVQDLVYFTRIFFTLLVVTWFVSLGQSNSFERRGKKKGI